MFVSWSVMDASQDEEIPVNLFLHFHGPLKEVSSVGLLGSCSFVHACNGWTDGCTFFRTRGLALNESSSHKFTGKLKISSTSYEEGLFCLKQVWTREVKDARLDHNKFAPLKKTGTKCFSLRAEHLLPLT